jgi:hypothetical protein
MRTNTKLIVVAILLTSLACKVTIVPTTASPTLAISTQIPLLTSVKEPPLSSGNPPNLLTPNPTQITVCHVSPNALHLREWGAPNAPIVDWLNTGESVIVLESGEWARVSVRGKIGYIKAEYCK